MFELSTILLMTSIYLTLVFLAGIAAEKPWFPKSLLHHPAIYTLSLGGYVGTWAIFGALELAETDGYTFLAYYLGTSALFIFSPLLLQPLLNLSRTYQLKSLADLFSFRYSSQSAGLLVSLGTLVSILPLLALQIGTLAESVNFLMFAETQHSAISVRLIPVLFCIIIAIFSLRFGNRNPKNQSGLIVITALQSLIKLGIFFSLGAIAVYSVFGSPVALEQWLYDHPAKLASLNASLTTNNSRTLMLIFFAAALSFPHMYHLAITENRNPRSLSYASWAFPLYLLLLSLPTLPILWAGEATQSPHSKYFLALALGEIVDRPIFTLLAYLCGLAAASSSMIVIIISVASMSLNHLVLPYYSPHTKNNLYLWLGTVKSSLMIALIALSYLSYEAIRNLNAFNAFSFASYTAAFQFLPGILATFYWPKGNRTGLIAGLITGFICWLIFIVLPMISPNALGLQPVLEQLFNLNGDSYWVVAAIACLGLNMLTFGTISVLSKSDEEQRNAAEICSQDNLSKPILQQLTLTSVSQFIEQLSLVIGQETARREIESALVSLNMQMDENRPFALRLLRRQIESNLSGLFGPTVARQLVARQIPYQANNDNPAEKDIQLIEHRLKNFPEKFSGLAEELDSLRRYHRNTVENLPIGVCTLNSENEIIMWNQAMASLTQISTQSALGSPIASLHAPWNTLFLDFMASNETQWHKHPLVLNHMTCWFTLHKTPASETNHDDKNNTLLLEEVTATVKLEHNLVHNERLASIGRLAAGVAHEIGNPVTGIACLAQNLKYDSDKPEITEAAKDILTQTQRITRIVQSLINFSHAGSHVNLDHQEPVNLYSCTEDAIHLLSLDQRKATEAIHNNIDRGHIVNGDAQRLLQVFLNLLKNALEACDDPARITLESRLEGEAIEIMISDNGAGIPQSLHDQIFEPFFTTKDPGEGTGLGLAVSYSIIEEHHGHIEVISPVDIEKQRGTCFIIRLPKTG
jgi:signal transduction histidine kinase/Na+/proline symporter